MKTASFQTYRGPGRISIARGAPRRTPAGFRVYRPLAPGVWFKSLDADAYVARYRNQLDQLVPAAVVNDLHHLSFPHEPILLCWEVPPFDDRNFCHRRIVADWLLKTLCLVVDEYLPAKLLHSL